MQEHQMHLQRLTQAVVEAKDEAEKERLEKEKFEQAQSESKRERKKLEHERKAMRKKIQELETRLRRKEEEERADRSSARKRTTPQSVHRLKESMASGDGSLFALSQIASPSELRQTKKTKIRSSDDADFDRIGTAISVSMDEITACLGQAIEEESAAVANAAANAAAIENTNKKNEEVAAPLTDSSTDSTDSSTAATTSGHRLVERPNLFSTMLTSAKAPGSPNAPVEAGSKPTFNRTAIESFVGDVSKSKRLSSSSALSLTLASANGSGRDSIRSTSSRTSSGSGKLKLKFAINKKGQEKLRSEMQLLPQHHQTSGLTDSPSKRIITDYKLDNNCTSKEAHRFQKARKKEMERKKKAKADMGKYYIAAFLLRGCP
jgi:hypothetical protein